MKPRTRFVALVGLGVSVLACSGNRFESEGPSSEPPSDGGKSGGGNSAGGAEPSDGGDASSAGGDGAGTAGSSAPSGGSSFNEGGAAPATSGGDSGAGGDDSGPTEPVFTMSKLIDDMEDGNATLLETNGDWFVIKDPTNGTITPPKGEVFKMTALSPARGASTKAAVVTVSGFTGWGAALGFDFLYSNGNRLPIDLEEALAVRFWAKASKVTSVRFQLPNADTDTAGGKCAGDGDNACDAHFTKGFSVSTEWKQITISFSDLKQDLAGRRAPTFDKHQVFGGFFVIGPNQSVTLWIDDLALVH